MGRKEKKKVKGGIEKTTMKTEKKFLNKIKKEMAAKGEADLEKLIAQYQVVSPDKKTISVEVSPQPSVRSSFSFCAHPDKEELILFGGEYYNGSTTAMYNEVYFYNIKKSRWSILQGPVSPPPRCSHQAVAVSQNGGQMWIFGGEFASPSKSNFYHYKDLWVLNLTTMTWEQVKAAGGPSARSGHRMVVSRKNLVVFGGFHEIVGDYKCYNDVHLFNLETYTWSKIEPAGKVPAPRSGCLLAPLVDGRILVYGGYTKEKVRKDIDKGTTHTDMFYLHADERTGTLKWKWVQAKPGGMPPSTRCGMSLCVSANNQAFTFGGVKDEEEDDESFSSMFYNDLFRLELEKGRWTLIALQKKSDKKKRRKGKDEEEEENMAENLNKALTTEEKVVQTSDDIFTVKIGPSSSQSTSSDIGAACASGEGSSSQEVFVPNARMNAGLALKNSILYLYGGMYEVGDRQTTLSDFYALDVHKLDEWQTLVPFSDKTEWIESEDSEDDEKDAQMDSDEDEDDDGMETE